MAVRISCKGKGLLFSLLLLLSFSTTALSFQTKISGVINKYGKVTGIGTDYVIVNDPAQLAQFSAGTGAGGDTVLLIQMKGAQGKISEDNSYGNLQFNVGSPGKYEFLIIQSIDIGLKRIVFRNNISNSFDITGDVQIVKTPSYNSVVVDADLTSAPWDSVTKIGGVLAMIVGKTIKLNANIDVTGKGFLGGGTVTGMGLCVNSNSSRFDKYFFHRDSTNSGLKGESPVSKGWVDFSTQFPIFPSYFKGKGANFTGGGGGNGNFSGGGGGANYGLGGQGGRENSSCFPPNVPVFGGVGGKYVKSTPLEGGILLGAGGGSSTYFAGSTPSPGGNGGGILIILCDSIIGNGKIIKADGAGASGASGNAGAGGGGGGGSIALYLAGFSTSNINISASGGKGGNNSGTFGEGGGGGGGLIWINNITVNPLYVTRTVTGGSVGTRPPGGTFGNSGTDGESLTSFVAVLNGFLFNSIRSSVTGDQIDSICSNMIPRKITGTKPVGGMLPYIFLWEKSYNEVNWTPLSNDADPTNYTPAVIETSTVYFRRTITDSSIPALVDVSKPVKIIVQPFIKNNIIGTSDTICFAQNPPAFTSKAILLDGNGKYAFKWQVSLDNSLFNLPANPFNSEGYTPPPALLSTSWYRRTITSGRCVDSTAIVKITVLPDITANNILSLPQEICYGMLFADLSATTSPALAGGDNSYRFKWESSTNETTWVTATGVSSGVGYNPDELSPSFPGNEYYRRAVYSGIHDVCVNISASVLLKDFPVLTNNTITANQTICSGSVPAKLLGSNPLNGAGTGTYTYTWQDSTKSHTWIDIPGAIKIASPDYQPPALTDTTRYRRIVFSSTCSDISKSIIVNVHKPIANNNIFLLSVVKWDTIICSGATPRLLKGSVPAGGTNLPGDYAYEWYYSLDKSAWTPVSAAGTNVNYQPGALTVPTYYRRKVISGTCIAYSDSIITIKVLPLISLNTVSSDQTVCYNTIPVQLSGSDPAGGAGTGSYLYLWRESPDGLSWANATGTNNGKNYQPPALTSPKKYKRIVRSGSLNCCIDSSNIVSIGIYALPTGTITTVTDTTVCEGSPMSLRIHLTGASKWTVKYTENATQVTLNKVGAADTTLLLKPSITSASAIFNYALYSIQDNNGCIATSMTGIRKLTIYKIPNSVAGSDASVCGPAYPLKALPSIGSGTWSWAKISTTTGPGNATFTPNINDSNAKVSVDSTTAAWGLENKYKFIWKEANWLCSDKDSVIITFNKRTDLVASRLPVDLYSLDKIDTLRTVKPLVGTGIWSVISGDATISKDSIVSDLSAGENKFEWTITNGVCLSKGQFIIYVYELKIPEGFSPNSDLKNDEFVIEGLDVAYNDVTLRVLNSAGTEVFYSSNLDGNTWSNFDGENSNGTLPEGTYYYLLTIRSKRTNSVLSRSGFIILKRYNSQ
jgi:gliding motility-associated-like protein